MTTKRNVKVTYAYSPTLPTWTKLSYWQKVGEIVRFAGKQNGQAVTLNMSPEFEGYVLASSSPKRAIAKRMNEELSKVNLNRLPILLILEITREGRPHLHGVIIQGGIPTKEIQKAMRRAVGNVAGHSGSRQFASRAIYNANGWSNYITTDLRRTKKNLSVRDESDLVWKSHSITEKAREHYEAHRLKWASAANLNAAPVSTAV